MKFKLSALVFSVLLVVGLTGCANTAEGFGRDMQHNGHEIEKAANS